MAGYPSSTSGDGTPVLACESFNGRKQIQSIITENASGLQSCADAAAGNGFLLTKGYSCPGMSGGGLSHLRVYFFSFLSFSVGMGGQTWGKKFLPPSISHKKSGTQRQSPRRSSEHSWQTPIIARCPARRRLSLSRRSKRRLSPSSPARSTRSFPITATSLPFRLRRTSSSPGTSTTRPSTACARGPGRASTIGAAAKLAITLSHKPPLHPRRFSQTIYFPPTNIYVGYNFKTS